MRDRITGIRRGSVSHQMEIVGLAQAARIRARRTAGLRATDAKPASGQGQQVAALCWRQTPELEVLLITSLRTRRWILPKGWPMPGLTLAQSAAREALEEAGVVGEIAPEPFGHYDYMKEKKSGITPLTVEIFSLRVTSQRRSWPEKGTRDVLWLPAEKAARLVGEPALRRIIQEFRKSPRRLLG